MGNVPYWDVNQRLTLTGSVQVINDQYVLINSASIDPTNPEALMVFQKNSSSVNVIGGYGSVDNFFEINIQNQSSSKSASSDLCATADIGTVNNNYIDVGIASSNYTGSAWPWTKALDGYVQMDGGDLWLALSTNNKLLFAFNNVAATSYANSTGFYLSGSWFGTSSWASSASWVPAQIGTSSTYPITSSWAVSASWAPDLMITSGSTYPITSSWATTASFITASNVDGTVVSSSYAITSSYAFGVPSIKSGIIIGGAFAGNPKTASIVFTKSFANNNYSVTVTGEVSRTWTVSGKVSGSFVINSNNNTAFTTNVFWQAIATGEYY